MKPDTNTEEVNYQTNPYVFYVNGIIDATIPLHQVTQYNELSLAYNDCFFLAKQKKITEAAEAYDKGCTLQKFIDPALDTWITVFCGPNLSYYYYKTEHYNESISLTHEIIETCRDLQNRGYYYLFFSEIQQYHNLSRIFFTLNNTEEALYQCTRCMADMADRGTGWDTQTLINGIPEMTLIRITQYGMIIQVLTETCGRLLRTYGKDPVQLRHWLAYFLAPLSGIRFATISDEHRYKYIDAFISFLHEAVLSDNDINEDNLLLTEKQHVDKTLLSTFYQYVKFVIAETETAHAA